MERIQKKILCPSCFEPKESGTLCTNCGFDGKSRQPALALQIGTILNDNYVVGRVLGRLGGFGITYVAWDKTLQKPVAIKEFFPRELVGRDDATRTIRPHSDEDRQNYTYGLNRFLEEARTVAQFDHPNIVRVRSFFQENGTAYLVMDYYRGETLEARVADRGGMLPKEEAIPIIMAVMDGLREVHAKGYLHRDVKPQNIYITAEGRVILLDFGSARAEFHDKTRSRSIVYTPGFAPVEQMLGTGVLGPWTDVYGVAAVLHFMLSGEVLQGVEKRIVRDDVPQMLLQRYPDEGLRQTLESALAVDPYHRMSSIKELQGCLSGTYVPQSRKASPASASPAMRTAPLPPPHSSQDQVRASRGRSLSKVLLAGLAVVLLGGGAFAVYKYLQPTYDPAAVLQVALTTESDSTRDSLLADLRMQSPFSFGGVYARTDSMIANRHYRSALLLSDTLIHANRSYAKGYHFKALALSNLGHTADALEAVDKAIALDAGNALFHETAGWLYNDLEKYDNAIAAFTRSVGIKKNKILYRSIVWMYAVNDMPTRAREMVDSLIDGEPSNSDYRIARAMLFNEQKRYYEALAEVAYVLQMEPRKAEAHRVQSIVYFNTREYDASIKAISQAIKYDGQALYYAIRADYHKAFGHYRKAYEDYSQAVQIDEYFTQAYLLRGNIRYDNMNDERGACIDWKTAAELGSADAESNLRKFCK